MMMMHCLPLDNCSGRTCPGCNSSAQGQEGVLCAPTVEMGCPGIAAAQVFQNQSSGSHCQASHHPCPPAHIIHPCHWPIYPRHEQNFDVNLTLNTQPSNNQSGPLQNTCDTTTRVYLHIGNYLPIENSEIVLQVVSLGKLAFFLECNDMSTRQTQSQKKNSKNQEMIHD